MADAPPERETGAIVRRLKKLLEAQRDAYGEYLGLLEGEADAPPEALEEFAALENAALDRAAANQKAAIALAALYSGDDGEISALTAQIEGLRAKAQERITVNRRRLQSRMAEIRQKLAASQNPFRSQRSVYAQDSLATLVRIEI